jgi:hypothetical protein
MEINFHLFQPIKLLNSLIFKMFFGLLTVEGKKAQVKEKPLRKQVASQSAIIF